MGTRADEMPKFDQHMTLLLLPAAPARCYRAETMARDGAMRGDLRSEMETWLAALGDLLAAAAPQVPTIRCTVPDSRFVAPHPVRHPIVDHVRALARGAPPQARTLVEHFAELAPFLGWRQTYDRAQASAAFLRGYGWTELIGRGGVLREPGISAGLLLLGPDCHYPEHRHPALEYYVPLSGTARWFDSDLGWREVPPLRTIVHRSGIDHAMHTGAEPLLAYFHWSGAGVGDHARFSAAGRPAIAPEHGAI